MGLTPSLTLPGVTALRNPNVANRLAADIAGPLDRWEAGPDSWTIDDTIGEDRVVRLDNLADTAFVEQTTVSLAPVAWGDDRMLLEPGEYLSGALSAPINLASCTLYARIPVDDQVDDRMVLLYGLHAGDPTKWADYFGMLWDGLRGEVLCIYGDGGGNVESLAGPAPVNVTPNGNAIWTFKTGASVTRKFYVGGSANLVQSKDTDLAAVATHLLIGEPA